MWSFALLNFIKTALCRFVAALIKYLWTNSFSATNCWDDTCIKGNCIETQLRWLKKYIWSMNLRCTAVVLCRVKRRRLSPKLVQTTHVKLPKNQHNLARNVMSFSAEWWKNRWYSRSDVLHLGSASPAYSDEQVAEKNLKEGEERQGRRSGSKTCDCHRKKKKEWGGGRKSSIFRRYSLPCWNMLGAHKCRHARNTHTHTQWGTPTGL